MKKSLPIPRWGILLALTVALASACDQGAIFYNISKEIKPKDPVVEGTPSKLVESAVTGATRLYVANGDLWSYDGSSWSKPSGQPSGAIRDVAATSTALYVMTLDGADTALYKSINGTSWTQLVAPGAYPFLQSIYGAGTTLFVGARDDDSDDYAVYYDNAGVLASVKTGLGDGGLLVGAVYGGANFYIATRGEGIFAANSPANLTAATAVTGSTDSAYQLNGLIQVGTTKVVAVGHGGYLLHGDTGGFTAVSYANTAFTGALALWDDGSAGNAELLLLGYEDTDDSYTFGYREIVLVAGEISGTSLQEPGEGAVSSEADNATYVGSLGKKVVNHLFQTSLGGRTLFAATQFDGLWSYRDEWNAED